MMFFKNKNFVVHILCFLWGSVNSIKFYEGNKSEVYDCSVGFEPKKEFTCVCLSGVWKFYKSECEEIRTVGGIDFCLELQDPVGRAEKILDTSANISIRYPNGSLLEVGENTAISVDVLDLFTTGANWTISSEGVSVCLSPVEDNYCQFNLDAPMTQAKFTKECEASSVKLKPKNCEYLQSSDENICETKSSRRAGRVFLLAPGMNKSVTILEEKMVEDDDEDFFLKDNITESRDEISTEIWNFIDRKLDYILQISESPKPDIHSKLPLFHILQLARDVMKKTCPDFYMNPQFFDMATYTFIEMQKKAFKQDDYPREYFAYLRIISALKNCTENAEMFPFINNFTCEDGGEPRGVYRTVLDTADEMNILEKALPSEREPIIETVWKIFTNAHATCYQYFDDSYNDHHRFTTWITPLFQNNINDVWLKDATSNKTVFGNMFGNMYAIQTRITYCSAYARLVSDYPWDFPIPPKINDPLAAGSTGGSGPIPGRRKRSTGVSGVDGQCIANIQLPKC